MITVEELIERLKKLPKDLLVVLNFEVVVEQGQFVTSMCDPGDKQRFVILSHAK